MICCVDEPFESYVGETKNFINLKKFSIYNLEFSNKIIHSTMPKLKSLDLTGTKFYVRSDRFPSLSKLKYTFCNISQEDLIGIESVHQLKDLEFNRCTLDDYIVRFVQKKVNVIKIFFFDCKNKILKNILKNDRILIIYSKKKE